MFYDLIHNSCLTSSKEASLKAVKLSQSKMRYPNLWGLPVQKVKSEYKVCLFTCVAEILQNGIWKFVTGPIFYQKKLAIFRDERRGPSSNTYSIHKSFAPKKRKSYYPFLFLSIQNVIPPIKLRLSEKKAILQGLLNKQWKWNCLFNSQ